MRLEFELDIERKTEGMIQYNVKRKGLVKGILVLDEEYAREGVECKTMEME